MRPPTSKQAFQRGHKEFDMPFKSLKQMRYMYAKHPDIAKRWHDEGKGYVAKLKKHVQSKKS